MITKPMISSENVLLSIHLLRHTMPLDTMPLSRSSIVPLRNGFISSNQTRDLIIVEELYYLSMKIPFDIKFKNTNTNYVAYFLSWPLIVTLTIILNSFGNDTSRWTQLYANDLEFTTQFSH